MKKNILLAVLPATCIATSAATAQCPCHYFDGVYVGAGGGLLQSFSNVKNTASSTFVTAFDEGTTETLSIPQSNTNLSEYFGSGTVYIGFGQQVNQTPLYLGAEIFGAVGSKNNSITNNASNVNVSTTSGSPDSKPSIANLSTNITSQLRNFEYGIDLKPGLIFNNTTLVYGRFGAAFNKLSIKSNTNLNVLDLQSGNSATPFLNLDNTKSVTGLRLGIGVEHALSCNFAITADYIYTTYGNDINVNDPTAVIIAPPTPPPTPFINSLTNSASTSMTTQSIMFGLKYYFDKTAIV